MIGPAEAAEGGMDEQATARLLNAVGDPTRLRLLRFVLDEEHCVSQCTEHVGLTQGAVSKQLGILAEVGLLSRRRASRRAYYQVRQPDLVRRIFADASRLAAGHEP